MGVRVWVSVAVRLGAAVTLGVTVSVGESVNAEVRLAVAARTVVVMVGVLVRVGVRAFVRRVRENAPYWSEKLPEIPGLIYDALTEVRHEKKYYIQ